MTATTAYLDASAAAKLRAEPETSALQAVLTTVAVHVSSELLQIELRCVAHREVALESLVLVTYDQRQAQAGRAAGLDVVVPT